MPTNFSFSRKSLVCVAFFLVFITSCSTPSSQTTSVQPRHDQTLPTDNATSKERSAQFYLQQAKEQPTELAIENLLLASEAFLNENGSYQALWLSKQVEILLSAELENIKVLKLNKPSLKYRLILVKAQALNTLAQTKLASEQLQLAQEYALQQNLVHNKTYYQITTEIAKINQQQVAYLDAKLRVFAFDNNASQDEVFTLWQALSALSLWQVDQLVYKNSPHIKGWQSLLSAANLDGSEPLAFKQSLLKWQKRYPTHPANVVLPSLTADINESLATSPLNYQNIAVILPLSGRQKSAGKTAQQGILTAYQQHPNKNIYFFDESKLDMLTLHQQLTDQQIDFVIGPLLKTNVDEYLATTTLILPTLLLNLPSAQNLLPQQSAFSMRREDEAMQAATSLSQRDYQHPMILSAKSSISKRIATAFIQQWQQINQQQLDIVYFGQGDKMQKDLKTSLDVDASEQRIKELKRRLKQKIKFEFRNRRDIDMIYLVGSPEETRLMKPYIDVNISPFAKIIPVYASSLSHSAKGDKNQNRDLYGLTFTEMPWLLKSKQQNKTLAEMSNDLWPQRTDSLQRIFAMGFDSLNLIDKLPMMKNKQYIRHFGQTGILQYNDNQILTRSLIWGRYMKNQVQEISIH